MTTEVYVSELLQAVKEGSKSIHARATLPVLAGFLIRRWENRIGVISYNFEKASLGRIPVFKGENHPAEEWAIVITWPRTFHDWLAFLEAGDGDTVILSFESRVQTLTATAQIGKVRVTAHFKGLDAEEFPLSEAEKLLIAQKPVDPWLALALSKDEAQPAFSTPHSQGNLTIGSDKYRFHAIGQAMEVNPEAEGFTIWETIQDLLKKVESMPTYGKLSNKHVMKAVKACQKRQKKQLTLSLNGSAVFTSVDVETGELSLDIQPDDIAIVKHGKGKRATVETFPAYEHGGKDATIRLNPSYMIDALKGLPEIVTFATDGNMLYLAGEVESVNREAIVMGMGQ